MKNLLNEVIGDKLYQIILSNPKNKEKITKVKIRPVIIKMLLCFQETAYRGTQVFHTNLGKTELIESILKYMEEDFRQCEIEAADMKATILISKKGKMTIHKRLLTDSNKDMDLSHNRKKVYILEEGKTVPFLVDLGVQTEDGKIVKSKYDKFKQINRFLEFVEDILPVLSGEKKIRILDFGCGKSYLTFAMYYYLKILQGINVQITGLDLKKDVICSCNNLAVRYGYEELEFRQGDINDYEQEGAKADMVVTLHACDTATDYALRKAVEWDAKVILSVPCCHHEVNGQIECEQLWPALKYGLIKERMASLITDAIRANMLEEKGYEVQILEFIDLEHTPKNILIRAVKKSSGKKEKSKSNLKEMTDFLHVETTLQKLM